MEDRATAVDQLTEREAEILERLSNGFSDQQIADELYLSLNTVKWYNRQIYSKLGVSSRTQAIISARHSDGRNNNLSTMRPAASKPKHNLPAQATPFVGRRRETEEAKQLLRSSRLLTLTGTGGTGKTRLALQMSAEVADNFADGVFFVDLGSILDHALVLKTIAGTLGVFDGSGRSLLETLKRMLVHLNMLLVLDNFEQVIEAAPLISELLAASAHLKILVTSREPLHLSGEQEYAVPPLSLPAEDSISVQTLAESEAGALFLQRAQMTLSHFALTDENVGAIAEICFRLDGLPLAIELAAARCKLLTPRALLERLDGTQQDSPFHALSNGSRDVPARHRTMRDSIEWSYNLLSDDERTLFARLSAFCGSRSLEAIQAVCGVDPSIDVLDSLSSLVDKGLVQQKETADGEPRFAMLEMIYAYAHERLKASGEEAMVQQRHAAYYVALAERAEPELRQGRYDYWTDLFDMDLGNIRTALDWSLNGGDLLLGVRLATACGQIWYGKGYHVEGRQWTQQLLARLDEVPIEYHAKFLITAGHKTFLHDLGAAQDLFRRALASSRKLGDTLQSAWALAALGYTMLQTPDSAMSMAEEGLTLFRQLGHQPGIAQALNIMGEIARCSGDDARARRFYEECLEIVEQTGEKRRLGYTWENLAFLAQHAGDHERALDLGYRALQLAHKMKNRLELATALEVIAGSLAALGQAPRAARLLGASESAHERLGAFHQPSNIPELERIVAEVHAQLDDSTFGTAWTEGRDLTLEQAVADVLALCVPC